MEKIEVAQMEFLERIEGRTQNLKRNLYVVSAYYAPVRSTEERKKLILDLIKLFEWKRGKCDLIVGG